MTDAIIQSVVQDSLRNGMSLSDLQTHGVILNEQHWDMQDAAFKEQFPSPYDVAHFLRNIDQQMRMSLDKEAAALAATNLLAKRGVVLDAKRIDNIKEDEDIYKSRVRPYQKALDQYEQGEIKAQPMALIHPCETFVNTHPLLSDFFKIKIPPPKTRDSARRKRMDQGRDLMTRRAVWPEETDLCPVGSLSDLNRIALHPSMPELADCLFDRINFYQRYDATENRAHEDILRSVLKVGMHGLHDQKNYLGLTEGVLARYDNAGQPCFTGTMAEVAILSEEQYRAKQERTDALYKTMRKFEGKDHAVALARIDDALLVEISQDYSAHVERFRKDAPPSLLAALPELNESPLQPFSQLMGALHSTGENRPTPAKVAEARCQGLLGVYRNLQEMQIGWHARYAAYSPDPWRIRYIEDALRHNKTVESANQKLQRKYEDENAAQIRSGDAALPLLAPDMQLLPIGRHHLEIVARHDVDLLNRLEAQVAREKTPRSNGYLTR